MRLFKKLPQREQIFVTSLLYHGFRFIRRRKNLKRRVGYIISSTRQEDASGIDFWVKMPGDRRLFPIQVTQRGVRLFRKYHRPSKTEIETFHKSSQRRVSKKQRRCRKHGIAFVLVRDFDGTTCSRRIAWGDIKALRYGIAHLKRWL